MAESVLGIALLSTSAVVDSEGDEGANACLLYDRRKEVVLFPITFLGIPENDSARLCAERVPLFVGLDVEDVHGGDRRDAKAVHGGLIDDFVRVKGAQTVVLFLVCG